MENCLGKNLAMHRAKRGLTQDQLAEQFGVTAQAVSKWETGGSCPDVAMLAAIADFFSVSIDELIRGERPSEARLVPSEERKDFDKMLLKVVVDSAQGDRVRVNLPLPLVKLGLELGMQMPQINGLEALQKLDLETIFRLVDSGAVGKLVEVESAEGDNVQVVVE